MVDLLNSLAMLATVAFGLIGWLAPAYTMRKLKLACTDSSTLGKSEIRAANGALFVGLGMAALLLGHPMGFTMVGFAYAGAAIGRLTSIVLDGSGEAVSYSFLLAEIALAVYLVWANMVA